MNSDDNNDRLEDSERAERLNAAVDRLLGGEPVEVTDPLLGVARHLRNLPVDPSPIARARFDQQVRAWFESDQEQAVGFARRSWRQSLITLIGIAAVLVFVVGLGYSYLGNVLPAARPTPTTAYQLRTMTITNTVTTTASPTVTASPSATNTITPSVSPSNTSTRVIRISPTARIVPANPSLNPVVATSAPYPQPTISEADAVPPDHQPEPTETSSGS